MVITKTSTTVIHPKPCIKEVSYALMPGTATVPRVRTVSRRVAELPSLRYGTIGANSPISGPLRVQYDPPVKKYHRSFTTGFTSEKVPVIKTPTRRVRFDLPPTDGSDSEISNNNIQYNSNGGSSSSNNTGGVGNVEHVNSWVRSRRSNVAPAITSVTVVSSSTPVRQRAHTIGKYVRGTLSPTAATNTGGGATPALLKAAREADDVFLKDILRRAVLVGIPEKELNAQDISGRTAISYIASNGSVDFLETIVQLPGLDVNLPDNEGNTPLHFAAQAGQVECLNYLLSRCQGLEIDARNNLGFTPLMKAALQGRNKCAKLLLFAGANPTLRDTGRGLRAEQWARYCGRYVCADVIEKFARHRLLERSTSCGRWGSESDIGTRLLLGKVVPVPAQVPSPPQGIKSKLRKVFRTSSGPSSSDTTSSARLVTQLTSAALCASSPVLPAPQVSPVVKSLIRPLTVPRLQITLANGEPNGIVPTNQIIEQENQQPMSKPPRSKKKLK